MTEQTPEKTDGQIRERAISAMLLMVAAVGALHVLYYFPRNVDDMFIYLRYAENIANGDGFVYNLGERVEGYSGPLWQVTLALGALVGLGGVSWSKVLGVLSLLALGAGVYRLGRERFSLAPSVAAVATLALALNSYVISWGIWGLETPAYLACIVWTGVWMNRRAETPSRRTFVGLAVVAAALLLSRPEAPLFAGVLGIAEVLRKKDEFVLRLKRLLPPSLAATAVLAGYMLFRRYYFGLWLPHTHYAKQGGGFDVDRWGPLVVQGASVFEIAAFVGACLAALYLLKKRDTLPALLILGVLFFVGLVERDWMPNMRHFLPLQVLLPVATLGAASAIQGGARKWAVGAAVVLTLVTGLDIAQVDSRFSVNDFQTHGHGEVWRRPKTQQVWIDTWACLNAETPEHVRMMGPYHHGMISQLYAALEADGRPLQDVWFVARDIGRIGWLSPIKVFDTDGLFTPDVVELGAETVSTEVLERAFSRPVAMTELYGPWARALSLPDIRARYEARPDRGHLGARNMPRPGPEVILARYEAAAAKMPTAYYGMTLYGEGVGAAIARRVAFVRQQVEASERAFDVEVPNDLNGPAVTLDGSIVLLGCEYADQVRAGEALDVTCYLQPIATPTRDYTMFVHVLGETFIHADHALAGGFVPTRDWAVGEVVMDTFQIQVPQGQTGEISPRLGLYVANHRAQAVSQTPEVVDAEGRVILQSIQIQ